MFNVLFLTACESDNEHVYSQVIANHKGRNGDKITVSHVVEIEHDILVRVPKIQKKRALIFDHSGSVHRLGFPDGIEYDQLPSKGDGLDKQEKVVKEVEKLEKLPKDCSKCHYLKPVGVYVCPKCGHKPLGGEDVETDVTRKLESLKVTKLPTKEEKQAFWSQLRGWQKERAAAGKPVKDGALAHKYRERFSVWPKGLSDSAKVPSPEMRNWLKSKQIAFAKRQNAK